MPHNRWQQNASPAEPPRFIVTASGKGGVGKTLLATAVIDLLDLHARPIRIIQLDDQDRLARTVGHPVVSVDTQTLRQSRIDPTAGTRAFRPLAQAIETIPGTGTAVVFDVGATQVSAFLAYAALAELDEELRELGIAGCVIVPVTAEPEAIRQGALTLKAMAKTLPSLQRIFVENRKDGALSDLVPNSDAHALCTKNLFPLLGDLPRIVMPAIEGGSWRPFERALRRPMDVIGLDIQTVMSITGLPRAEARISRGDVAAWFAGMESALGPVLGLMEVP